MIGSSDTRPERDVAVMTYSERDFNQSASAECNLCTLASKALDLEDSQVSQGVREATEQRAWVPVLRQSIPPELHEGKILIEYGNDTFLCFLPILDRSSNPMFNDCAPTLGIVMEGNEAWFWGERVFEMDRSSVMDCNQLVTADSPTIRKIKEWLESCEHHDQHRLCNEWRNRIQLDTFDQPRRLVECKGNKSGYRLRLIDTRMFHEKHAYATLSHCWGPDVKLSEVKLTFSKCSRYQHDEIPWSSLPKTFQDAVQIALALDIHFLWIDALCIVQDSPEDWETEASRMSGIYANATVCFVATAASNPTEGLLCQNPCLLPCIISPTWVTEPVRISVQYVLRWNLEGRLLGPLDTRAWAFQEQQLSPRKIFFTDDQIRWGCYAEYSSELGSYDGAIQDAFQSYGSTMMREEPKSLWADLISTYQSRKLTREADRLIAITGIAQAFAKLHMPPNSSEQHPWLAGLWNDETLHRQLMWRSIAGRDGSPINTTNLESDIAPSWSWTSVDCEIEVNTPLLLQANPRCTVISASIRTASGRSYAATATGELLLRTPIYQFHDAMRPDSNTAVIRVYREFEANRPTDVFDETGNAYFDFDPYKAAFEGGYRGHKYHRSYRDSRRVIEKETFTFLIPMYRNENREIKCLMASAVIAESGTYRRIGVVSLYFDELNGTYRHTGLDDTSMQDELCYGSTTGLPAGCYRQQHDDDTFTVRII